MVGGWGQIMVIAVIVSQMIFKFFTLHQDCQIFGQFAPGSSWKGQVHLRKIIGNVVKICPPLLLHVCTMVSRGSEGCLVVRSRDNGDGRHTDHRQAAQIFPCCLQDNDVRQKWEETYSGNRLIQLPSKYLNASLL